MIVFDDMSADEWYKFSSQRYSNKVINDSWKSKYFSCIFHKTIYSNHSFDIGFNILLKSRKKCARKPYFSLVNATTPSASKSFTFQIKSKEKNK